jgi:outer membrane protein OmpU
MKKILLASTALIAGASAAAADITLGGYGRFGVIYNDTAAQETIVDQRLRLIITGTAESQNGIKFTAQTRIQWDDGAAAAGDPITSANAAIMAAAFHASAGGLTLSLGNVSAAEATPGHYAGGIGYTGAMFVDPWSVGFFGEDIGLTSDGVDSGSTILATYKTGAFTFRASVSEAASERTHLGVTYADNGYVVALSHQDSSNNAEDITKLYVQGALGGATVGLFLDDTNAGNGWGVTGTMAVGAATKVTVTVTESAGGVERAGIGLNHDLGGGVSFGAGLADMNGATYAEAGVQFNF